MIGIKKQTAWYNEKAEQLNIVNFYLREDEFLKFMTHFSDAFAWVATTRGADDALLSLINNTPEPQRWYPIKTIGPEVPKEKRIFCAEYKFKKTICECCENEASELFPCERCNSNICNECLASYNQFTQIDYNCCTNCANQN